MAEDMNIVIENGQMSAIYDDRLLPYIDRIRGEFGLPPNSVKIIRATHVEPTGDLRREASSVLQSQGLDLQALTNKWWADILLSDGPPEVLGPFDTRGEALAGEKEWLVRYWLRQKEGRTVAL